MSGGGMMVGNVIGEAISGFGRYMGDRKRNKEWKKYQAFLRGVYDTYLNDPGRKEAQNFVFKLLSTGDYQDIFRNSLLEGLERTKADLLSTERAWNDRAARGGLLRSGQRESLLGQARDSQFQADRGAYRDYAANQFNAKTWAATQADNMAKGPFQAGVEIGAPLMINPYTGYFWNEVSNAGGAVSRVFGGQGSPANSKTTGQQTQGGLMGGQQQYDPKTFQLGQNVSYFGQQDQQNKSLFGSYGY